MRCPYCHAEMESGFLQGGDILQWNSKKQVLALTVNDSSVQLTQYNRFVPFALPTWICKNCRKIIAEYDENIDHDLI